MARVVVRVNCGPTWPIAPLRRDAKRVARRRREGTSAAALPPTPCSRLRAPTTPRSEMAAPASTECRRSEARRPSVGARVRRRSTCTSPPRRGRAATDGAAARTSLLVDNLGRGRKGRNPSGQHPRRAKRILSCPEVRARNAGSRALSARPALNATFGVSVACFTLRFVGCVPPLPFTTSEVLSELQKSQTFIFTYRSSTNPQSASGRSPRKFQANFAESSNVQSNGAL